MYKQGKYNLLYFQTGTDDAQSDKQPLGSIVQEGMTPCCTAHLEVKVSAIERSSLSCIVWLNLHSHRFPSLGSVYRLVIKLHAGNTANVNAALCGYTQRSTNLQSQSK